MLQELRFGLRMLRKQPGFTAIAVLTLALGIGATAAVFSLIQGVLLTPPPYRDPEQLVLIQSVPHGRRSGSLRGWPAAQWMEWQREAKSFEAIAGYAWTFNFLVSDEGSESLEGMVVTKDYFRVLGLQPMLGRTFLESEIAPSRRRRSSSSATSCGSAKFNGDPNIVGKTIRMSRATRRRRSSA